MDLKEVPTAETRYKDNTGFTKIGEEQLIENHPKPGENDVPGAGAFTLTGKTNVFYQEGLENEAKYADQ
jgi:hexosaminidase